MSQLNVKLSFTRRGWRGTVGAVYLLVAAAVVLAAVPVIAKLR